MKFDKIITVPKGIRYLSQWEDFSFQAFPEKCIIDKQIPGCGYTEWCLTNNDNVILASPRRILLQNKYDQHPDEIYLVVNELDADVNADEDISKDKKVIKSLQDHISIPEDEIKARTEKIFNRLISEIENYINLRAGRAYKILVTYDSYDLLRKVLMKLGIFYKFHTVVDEFQSILHDARFKSTTELNFMNSIRTVDKVHFVSATPTLEKYTKMLPDFKDLPYFEIDWGTEDSSRVRKPDLKVLSMKSVGEILPKVIKKFQDGKYDILHLEGPDGVLKSIVSDEAVFYVNSVKHIISAIKKCELKPEEVNILCSNTPENIRKIDVSLNKRVDVKERGGSKFEIGGVPLRGIKPKKYTFCTRTVYLGADFYSECATTYIFSDSNLDCLAVDISQDLPQILGRQRLLTNPWKNTATFYFRPTAEYNKMTEEDFNKELQKKIDKTSSLLNVYDKGTDEEKEALSENYEIVAQAQHYKKQYVAVTNGSPVFNDYAYVSDVRAFDIQQKDYKDRFTVFSETDGLNAIPNIQAAELLRAYESNKNSIDALKILCEYALLESREVADIVVDQLSDLDKNKDYYKFAGPEKCRALSYNMNDIKQYLCNLTVDKSAIIDDINNLFVVGGKYSKLFLKSTLQNIYSSHGYSVIAKATDLEKWFELKLIKVKDENNKWVNGFEILSVKS